MIYDQEKIQKLNINCIKIVYEEIESMKNKKVLVFTIIAITIVISVMYMVKVKSEKSNSREMVSDTNNATEMLDINDDLKDDTEDESFENEFDEQNIPEETPQEDEKTKAEEETNIQEGVSTPTIATQEEKVQPTKPKKQPEKVTTQKTEENIQKEETKQEEQQENAIVQEETREEQPNEVQSNEEVNVQEELHENIIVEAERNEPPKCTDTQHGVGVGNSNRWFDNYNDATEYFDSLLSKYSNQVHEGQITYEEYKKVCPYGYETWSCPYCGKWTLNFYMR